MIGSLEHVQLRVDLDYPNRAELSVEVQSSSGTSSKFLYPRRQDAVDDPRTFNNLVVTSVHFWGEPVLGKWIVDVKDIASSQRSGEYLVLREQRRSEDFRFLEGMAFLSFSKYCQNLAEICN